MRYSKDSEEVSNVKKSDNVLVNTSKPSTNLSSSKLRQLEKMDDYYEKQTVLYQKSVKEKTQTASIVASTPPSPPAPSPTPPPPQVKTATLDIILFDEESIPSDGMFDQIFENIGGQELINITRSDIVNGQKISYQPIKNLSSIQQRYNPNNILSLQQTSDKFFAGFSIKLENKIPEVGNGINGENIYLNETGDLIIEFINLNNDEEIEVQIGTSGTIYEADLGDYTSW